MEIQQLCPGGSQLNLHHSIHTAYVFHQVPASQSSAGLHLLPDVLCLPQPEDEHLQKEVHHQTGSDAPYRHQSLCMAQGFCQVFQDLSIFDNDVKVLILETWHEFKGPHPLALEMVQH